MIIQISENILLIFTVRTSNSYFGQHPNSTRKLRQILRRRQIFKAFQADIIYTSFTGCTDSHDRLLKKEAKNQAGKVLKQTYFHL